MRRSARCDPGRSGRLYWTPDRVDARLSDVRSMKRLVAADDLRAVPSAQC